MFRKENVVPTKQGVFYQLGLSKDNGPFLSKDIMYSNHKSNTLLTGKGILDEHKMMVQTLTHLEKGLKTGTGHEAKTENFVAVLQFCEHELGKSQEVSAALRGEEHKFRRDIEVLYERVSSVNNQLLQSSMPVLKNLMKRVKESNQADKAEYYKIQKELHSIEMQKRGMEHIIISCRNRVESLERVFGVGAGEEAPEKSSGFSTRTNNFFQ